MSQWIPAAGGPIIDTALGQGITEAGTYYLNKAKMDLHRPFAFGASVRTAGHTATVQLFAEVTGVKTNLGSALVPTNGSPASGANEYSLTADRGIVVSGITGTVYPEAVQ
jgi:hypothetical protein